MGIGEETCDAFCRHFSGLNDDGRQALMRRYPEPAGWEGFYTRIISSPWV